jgi:hypothetical protein
MLRPRLEAALSAGLAVMAVLTAIWPTWIEDLIRIEPDGGDGSAEWGVVALLALLALATGLLARRDHRLAVHRASAAEAGR